MTRELEVHVRKRMDSVSSNLTRERVGKEALISPRNAFGLILQPIERLGELRNTPPFERVLKAGGN